MQTPEALVALVLSSVAWLFVGNFVFHVMLTRAKREGNLLFY